MGRSRRRPRGIPAKAPTAPPVVAQPPPPPAAGGRPAAGMQGYCRNCWEPLLAVFTAGQPASGGTCPASGCDRTATWCCAAGGVRACR